MRQKIGDPGPIKLRTILSARFCLVKTPSIAIWGQQIHRFMKTQFFQFSIGTFFFGLGGVISVLPKLPQSQYGVKNKNFVMSP